MIEVRILARCEKDADHAKVLKVSRAGLAADPHVARMYAELIVPVLDGTSAMYHHPPGERSPVGRCAVCGGKLQCTVSEVEV